ncbi:hypothetical protein [Shewanella surugensis]|uniref:Uncharacterized protein n=1 Tax=Shewanella surugensis TaxID=212020 RepID=A0ABT0L5J0_9GAMM|nr:hypothetical protein [Shewanella surugensis]MCL1122956.1 hypothetical protein [Shewanella surugensis]
MYLDEALQRIAIIHQQHSIKCFLSLNYLQSHFDWPNAEWQDIKMIIKMEEPYFSGTILEHTSSIDVVIKRRHWVLQHALYPYSYFVMQQWISTEGFDTVFNYYLKECLQSNLYLNHHLSILLAFNEAFTLLENNNQILRFTERFCEFVTSTFYGNNQTQDPSSPSDSPLLANHGTPDIPKVLQACLTQPGFWGHNLITLSYLLKNEDKLTEAQSKQFLLHLYEQCHWDFPETADKPNINTLTEKELSLKSKSTNKKDLGKMSSLEAACKQLLLQHQSNLHQITLAAAVVYLFKNLSLSQKNEQRLLSIAHYFSLPH